MHKRKVIVIVLVHILILTGCMQNTQSDQKLIRAVGDNQINYQAAKEAILDGANVNELPMYNTSVFSSLENRPLGVALDMDNIEVSKLLIDSGADVNSTGADGMTYLQGIVMRYDEELFDLLLDSGADINKKGEGEYSHTPLESAIKSNINIGETQFLNMIYKMIDNGATVTDSTLNSALKSPSPHRYSSAKILLNILLKEDKYIQISDALQYAIIGDDEKLQILIEEKKAEKENDILLFAAAYCNTETLKALKNAGYSFNIKDANDNTLLHIASMYNTPQVVTYFFTQGLDPVSTNNLNSQEDDPTIQYTPFTSAVVFGNYEAAKAIMKVNDSVQFCDYTQEETETDLLTAAATLGESDSIAFVMNNGYPKNQYQYDNAIYCALSLDGDVSTIEKLFSLRESLKFDVMPSDISFNDLDPLSNNYVGAINVLIKEGFEITPYSFNSAILANNKEVIEIYLKNDAKLDMGDEDGNTPLICAISAGNLDLVKYLVEYGVSLEGSTQKDPLQYASNCPSTDIIRYLEKH